MGLFFFFFFLHGPDRRPHEMIFCWVPSLSVRRRLKDKEGEAVVRKSS